jgi:VIT family
MTDTASQESGDWHAAAGPGPATTGQAHAPQEARATLAGRIHRSFLASVGSIVFGMEDGTVSIFGLVFGVAASAPDSRAVLLAGGTGAVAAAVSMMAGTFLDVESTNDQAAARIADARARYEADPDLQDSDVYRRLLTAGLSDTEAATVAGIVGKHPETSLKLAAGLDLGTDQPARQSPVARQARDRPRRYGRTSRRLAPLTRSALTGRCFAGNSDSAAPICSGPSPRSGPG